MTKPANLTLRDRLEAKDIGTLTVVDVLANDDPEDLIEVDIEPDRGCDIWDMPILANAVGARQAHWLSSTPSSRYRLYFDPEADVTVLREGAPQ